jgi:NitT/TauT family transport system ATP-binding protein/sulfonate transport system ATP-binding protein
MKSKIKIAVENVSRTFVNAQGQRIEALKDIHFEVQDLYAPDGRDIGEFHVLVGPSGCGKSTVLRIIAGLDHPTSGRVLVNGELVTGPGPDRGMVFQKYTSFPWLTVAENVSYGLKLKGAPAEEMKKIVAHLIQAVGLNGFEKSYPDTLSGGMQQRVAIARTLAVRPQVVLMDEPFGALDAQTRSDMQNLLLDIWEQSASTILFVTHDVEEAIYLGDRLLILSARPGTIMEDVPVPFARPRDPAIKQTKEFQELVHYVLACLRRAPGSGQVRVSV